MKTPIQQQYKSCHVSNASKSTVSDYSANSADTSPIVVVLAADDNYAMQLSVVVCSVLRNFKSKRKLIFYIMDGGIRDFNKRRILKSSNLYQDRIEIKWLETKDRLSNEKLKISGHVSISTYFRLLIPELLPQKYEKVIYLDSDLVVNHDISKLWDVEIGESYLLAVQDAGIPYVSSQYGLMNYEELGIPSHCKYFNAGVLVINVRKWRIGNIGKKVIDYLEKNRSYIRWWDQDGLNAILAGCWGELDPRWNQVPTIHEYPGWEESPFSEEVYKNVVRDPYIIHFAQAEKPWNSRRYHPANELFFEYVDMTAWKGWRFSIWRRLWRRMVRETKYIKEKVVPIR